ncbi:Phenoxybenzoate dioxygenase subunit beta [Paraburkholderia piptadeniae]|uniref:Phenoxybenzoate dioxygenase subunit beta n=1 Tax=Paraburkholderia piptadeniae TaxID=1701573 RepID=A0A1N7SU82_9BURK|nr:PDR/VanB family oxidoreductase [Paraburkholderia piptadeniae]SIT51035.1 Phenoxybenzoate dioxygenase subunit beta [Paraburkholderia piptadeniae]
MSELPLTNVRVKSMALLADSVVSVVLEALDGRDLPAADAGSHIDVNLNGKLSRSYSVVRWDGTPKRYEIAVAKDASSRGGSRHIHETLRVGDVLQIGVPRNLFPLVEDASLSVLIAGGIGITPLWSMVQRLETLGRSWVLHYAARDHGRAAYISDIERFSEASPNGELHAYFDNEPGGQRLDIATVLREIPSNAHVYCCGPQSMLGAFEAATAGRPVETVHLERFAPAQHEGASQEFTVVLAKSGQSFEVPPDSSILDVLLENGIDVPFGCMQGACGLCETRVLGGTPDHRDSLLSTEARTAGQSMLICCSRSATPVLTLDA